MKYFFSLITFLIFTFNSSISWSEVGFRDLKIGSERTVIDENCKKEWFKEKDDYGYVYRCFNIDDLKFSFTDNIEGTIIFIKIDVGTLYQTFLDRIIGDPTNPFEKLKKNLDTNYQLEWEFTERDRKLFNEGERNSLWTSYNNGEVFSEIRREDKYSELRLFVHYHTKNYGKMLSEQRKPQNVDFNNF